jgi:hypothetical protein
VYNNEGVNPRYWSRGGPLPPRAIGWHRSAIMNKRNFENRKGVNALRQGLRTHSLALRACKNPATAAVRLFGVADSATSNSAGG